MTEQPTKEELDWIAATAKEDPDALDTYYMIIEKAQKIRGFWQFYNRGHSTNGEE